MLVVRCVQAASACHASFPLSRVHAALKSPDRSAALLAELKASLENETKRANQLQQEGTELAGKVTAEGAAATADVLDGLRALVAAKLQVWHLDEINFFIIWFKFESFTWQVKARLFRHLVSSLPRVHLTAHVVCHVRAHFACVSVCSI
jgi:hypothetical protein